MSTTKHGRLSEADIRGIVYDLHADLTQRQIADKWGCSRTIVYFIQEGKVHKDIVRKVWAEIEAAESYEPTEEELEAMIAANYSTLPPAEKRGRRSRKDSEE
jgi:hypothetical protein